MLLDIAEVFPDIPVLTHYTNIITGFGSDQGFKACTMGTTDRLAYCEKVLDYLRSELSDDQLTVLGMYKSDNDNGTVELDVDGKQVLRLLIAPNRMVVVGTIEHFSCGSYQGLAWTMPNRRTNSAQPAAAQNWPTVMTWANEANEPVIVVAGNIMKAFSRLKQSEEWQPVAEQFELLNENSIRACLDATPTDGCMVDSDVDDDLLVSPTVRDEEEDELEELSDEADGLPKRQRRRVMVDSDEDDELVSHAV